MLKAQEEVAAMQLKAEQEKNVAAAKLTTEAVAKLPVTAETATNEVNEEKGCLWRLRVMIWVFRWSHAHGRCVQKLGRAWRMAIKSGASYCPSSSAGRSDEHL